MANPNFLFRYQKYLLNSAFPEWFLTAQRKKQTNKKTKKKQKKKHQQQQQQQQQQKKNKPVSVGTTHRKQSIMRCAECMRSNNSRYRP